MVELQNQERNEWEIKKLPSKFDRKEDFHLDQVVYCNKPKFPHMAFFPM